jgi:hypothetical protein
VTKAKGVPKSASKVPDEGRFSNTLGPHEAEIRDSMGMEHAHEHGAMIIGLNEELGRASRAGPGIEADPQGKGARSGGKGRENSLRRVDQVLVDGFLEGGCLLDGDQRVAGDHQLIGMLLEESKALFFKKEKG